MISFANFIIQKNSYCALYLRTFNKTFEWSYLSSNKSDTFLNYQVQKRILKLHVQENLTKVDSNHPIDVIRVLEKY